MAKNRKFKPGDVRKYRVALTEAQIKRNIAILDKAIQDGDDTKTTESLRYNLNYVYVRILESELGTKETRAKLESQMGSEPRSGSDSALEIGELIHNAIQERIQQNGEL